MAEPETTSACSHGAGTAYVGGVCVFCDARRPPGRPTTKVAKRLALIDAFQMGQAAAGAPVEAGERPAWMRWDGKVRKEARNPMPYRRAPETAASVAKEAKAVALAERLRAARERMGRMSLAEFIKLGWHVVNPGVHLYWSWHMEAVADHVQRMFEELLKARRDPNYEMAARNLLVNIPPRSAKSMIVSVFAPAWAWLHDPALKIRCMSSNGKVAARDSRYCRDLIDSKWYRETFRIQWQVRSDIDGVELYVNTAKGERHATTFQSQITGEGTDVIIVDDPHDAHDVNSDVKRQGVLDKWDTAIESRVNDRLRCARIGVMQRLHEADWSGHVLQTGQWVHLYIPMEFEPDKVENDNGVEKVKHLACRTRIGSWTWCDPRTTPGELLHPDRFPLKELRGSDNPNGTGGMYKTLGSYGYAGQMQQRPAPADGGMFKRSWWRFYDTAPEKFEGMILSVDCNAKKTIDGSRTSLLVVGRKGAQRFILDNDTRITDFEEILQAVVDMRKKWPDITMTIVEDKANGPSVVNMLKKRLGRIEEQKVGSDSKESRARSIAPQVEAGDVFLPRHASWLDDFLHELSMFPNGAKDDQVDSLSQALIYMEGSNDAARFLAAWS